MPRSSTLDAGLVEPAGDAGSSARNVAAGRGELAGVRVDVDVADDAAQELGRLRGTWSWRDTVTTRLAAPDWSLSSSGVPCGDDPRRGR